MADVSLVPSPPNPPLAVARLAVAVQDVPSYLLVDVVVYPPKPKAAV